MIVEDDKVYLQTLVIKIFVPAQHSSYGRQIFEPVNSHKQDGQIATDRIGPETRLCLCIERKNVWAWSERWVRIDYSCSKSLKEVSLFCVYVEMAHLDLCFCPSQS